MAQNKRIDIEMRVLANTEQAKKQFENLQRSLTTAAGKMDLSAGFGKNFMNDIHAAQNEVAKLQSALQSAYNTETGKLDFTKLQSSMKSLGLDTEHVADTLRSMGPAGLEALKQLTIGVQGAEIPVKKLNAWFEKLATTLRNTIRWQISATALNTFVGAIQTAYGYAQDLNSSLNDIRIVTGYSAEKMSEFAENANKAAKSLSASTLAYTDAALIFYQQGLSDKEVLERTNATIKMSNVTGEQAEQVSSYMTAIWNNFADGSQTLEYYADVITELGARTAASSEEIAHGMEKFAAVGETVGLSYEYAAAAVTTVIDKTRLGADVVGTSFKTLFARLEGLSLGETLEDGTTLTKYSKALATVGVNIKDQAGQLKQMDEILDELGAKWEMLSSDQQVALAQTVGGVRQYTQLISLMENYDAFKENVEAARDSEGTLNKQQRIFEESWEGASKRLRASWESIYSDIIEDDFFIELTDTASKFLDAIDKILDRMGGLKGLLTQLAPIVTTVFNKQIANGIKSFGNNVISFAPGYKQKKETERQDMVANLFQGRLSKEQQIELRYTEIIRDNVDQLDELEKDRLFNLKEILKVQQRIGEEIDREAKVRNGEKTMGASDLARAQEISQNATSSLILNGGSDASKKSFNKLTGLKVAQGLSDISAYTPQEFYTGMSYLRQHKTLGTAFNGHTALVDETMTKMDELLKRREADVEKEVDVTELDRELEELQTKFGDEVENLLEIQARGIYKKLSQEYNQNWIEAPGSNDIKIDSEFYQEMRDKAVTGVHNAMEEASTQRANSIDVFKEMAEENRRGVDSKRVGIETRSTEDYATKMVGLAQSFAYASAASDILSNAISQLGDDSVSAEDKIAVLGQTIVSGLMQVGSFLQTDLGKQLAKSIKLDTFAEGMKGKIAGLMGDSGVLGSVLSAVPYVAIAAAVAKVAYDIIRTVVDTRLKNEQQKYAQGLEDTAQWRQENEALIEAIDNYHRLREEVDETGEYTLEFKDHILETAEALGIENAALLAQAGAYDLLKSKIEDTEGALEEEGRANSERDFANFQGLTSIGTQRANLTEDLLNVATGGLLSQAVTGRRVFEVDSLSGGYSTDDEGTFLKALGELGIENGLQIGANSFSYDFDQMSDADQVKFAQFLADVQNNAGAYGLGENSEFLKGISTISEDMETVASQLKDSLDYLVVASAREQGVEIRDRNNSDDSIFGYNADLEELSLALQEEYGLTEEDAYKYASQALNELYSGTVAAQSAVLKEYAEATGQDLNTVVASLEGYSKDDLASIITAMGANAAATHAILENIEGTTDQLEYINALIDQLDVTTLIASLDAIYEFIEKLKAGDTVKGEDLLTLASEMGFNSVEEFLTAFGDSFTKVANDKYIFTGVAEDFRRGFEDYTTHQITNFMNSDISYSDLLEQIGEGKTLDEWEDDAEASQKIINYNQGMIDALNALEDKVENSEFGAEYQTSGEDVFINRLGEVLGLSNAEAQTTYAGLIESGAITQSGDGTIAFTDDFDSAREQFNEALADEQETQRSIQEKIQALTTFEDLDEEVARWESGDKTAFEDQLVTEYTTLEELQDLYEEGYITADKYHRSIAAAALQEAEYIGIDNEELAEHANFLAENNEYLEDDIQASYGVALANERVNKGLEDLYDNMDDYVSILNEGRVDSEEYQETISSLSDDLHNMFNYDGDVSEDFILEHLTDIQAASEGDIDAVNRLQVAFAQMRVSEEDAALGMDDVWTEINAIDWDNIEIGVTMDTVPAMQSLIELMNAAGMSADSIQDVYNALGFEGEIEYGEGPNGERIITSIRNVHYAGTNRRGLNTNTKKNKSSGKTSKKDEKDFKDEFERYYKITRQIKDQQDATERLNKAKERAFGKAKLEYLDQEADSMQREIDLQKEYLDEIRGYYANDKGNLEAFGATFDENGVLTNYEQLINSELARYNQAVEAYNANQDEAAFESAEKRFNYFKDVLKQYDETNQLYQEQLDNLTDMQNKWYDMALQKTQLKVEMEIAIDDRDLELLEYALDRIEKKTFATAEALAKITQSVGDTLDKQKIYQDALEEILSRHGIDGIDAISSLSDEQIANLGFTQDEIDAIVEYNSNLLDTQKEMDKLQDEILNGPLKAFKEWNEEFDYQEDKIQRNIDLLNQYKNIADLIYSNSSAVGQEYIMSLMTNTYDSMVLGVDAARLELKANQEALEKAKQSYEEAIANGAGEETLNTLKKNLREMEKAVEDSEDDMLKKTEEALKQAEELFKTMIENAKNSFKELTSVTDWDMTQFDRLKSLDDEYLDDYAKIYEFAKLTRDINNSIDDTDTIRGKERLREITQEIADIEAQGREVSQYEVDALRAKYELRLAEIALEDAQNAKSVVRMNRDNEGNWSYVYTADEDNVDKARQNYEDKLYEYQKLNSEFIKTQQENFLKLEQEYTDAMQKIAEDSSLSREDKEARLQETQAYYQRMAEIMSDQLGIALSKNSELYNKDWLDYSQHTGYKISMEEEYQTKLDDTYTGHLQPNIDSATQLLAQFTEAAIGEGGFYPSIIGALDEFADRQDEVLQAAGTSLMDYADDMQRSAEDIETSMDEAAESMAEDFDTIMEKMAEINAASFDGLRDSVTNAISSINDLVAAYERLSNAASAAQDSSIGSVGGGLQDFSGSGGNNDGSGSEGTTTTTGNGSKGYTEDEYIKFAKFLYAMFSNRKNPSGAADWNSVLTTLSGSSSAKAKHLYKFLMANPGDNNIPGYKQLAQNLKQYFGGKPGVIEEFRNLFASINSASPYLARYSFDTGGYTGAWGTEGRLAFLHQKELVLNAEDTENMLNVVQMVRDITSAIDTRASMASVANINNGMYGSVGAGAQALDQNVHIEANFPNVTDHNEIEMALSNLVNQAAQYANRKS